MVLGFGPILILLVEVPLFVLCSSTPDPLISGENGQHQPFQQMSNMILVCREQRRE